MHSRDILAVCIYDPSLPEPVYTGLLPLETGRFADLVWSRSNPVSRSPAEATVKALRGHHHDNNFVSSRAFYKATRKLISKYSKAYQLARRLISKMIAKPTGARRGLANEGRTWPINR